MENLNFICGIASTGEKPQPGENFSWGETYLQLREKPYLSPELCKSISGLFAIQSSER